MKKFIAGLILSSISTTLWAVKLSDYTPFQFEILFTNPVCQTYSYKRGIITHAGSIVDSKPDDVYCKPADEEASVSRKNSPQYRLREWIESPDTKELHLAFLSFRSRNIAEGLCRAVKKGVKVKFILDHGEKKQVNKDAEALKDCGAPGLVETVYRGSTGGLGYAHNKVMIVNPGAEVVKIVYSSGNMTTGTSINHENWNFITTNGKSFFAQAHNCLISAMIEAGDTKTNFKNNLNDCRNKIPAPPETDIQVYFAPVDGRQALNRVSRAGHEAKLIEAMSHRFSGELAKLYARLLASGKPIKFILDDDIYWSATLRRDIGRNNKIEAFRIYNDLITKGLEVKFLQTNESAYQLQHNKIMIFHFENGGAVFNGAGNFTTSAFTRNFENFYYVTIPSVVEAYKRQYELYYEKMATAPQNMPRDYVLP